MEKITIDMNHKPAEGFIVNKTIEGKLKIEFVWVQGQLIKYVVDNYVVIRKEFISRCSLEQCLTVFC